MLFRSMSEKENILKEADRILGGDRQTDYGDFIENFQSISEEASRWAKKEITPLDCAHVMIAVKICREQYRHKRDNVVDLAAYLNIKNELIEVEK